MPTHLHLDFETFSEADIRAVGAYRYANDPSTEILCAAMAIDSEPVEIWDCVKGPEQSEAWGYYWDALEDPSVLIYAHNAMFEAAICQSLLWKTWGIPPPDLKRFRCTMSLARRAALPSKLEKLAEVLQLQNQKDKRGKSLIKKFSEMQSPKKPTKAFPQGRPARRIFPADEPEAFAEFCAYCAQDVRAEQEVAWKLAYFDEPINSANYSLDAVINARGVTVNLEALRHAQKLIEEETEIVSARFRELTGFEVTQGAVFLKWLHSEGVHLDNLQAETIETFLEQQGGGDTSCATNIKTGHSKTLTTLVGASANPVASEAAPTFQPESAAVLALRLKQSIAYASIKKVATMLACAGPHDNRIRGLLNFHGCTTGRWSASLVQFQNMKRPTVAHTEEAYREICNGISRDMLEIGYGPVLEVISSCIRHFVHDVKI